MNMKLTILVLLVSCSSFTQSFTRQDTLRGSITPERAWWNLTFYDLTVEINPSEKFIW